MTPLARRIQRTYLGLLLGNTLAGSLIWGINTLFLLDAGLTNLEAFAANSFFAGGMMLFEVPTGVVADTAGRRPSYLLGTVTLAIATLLYWFLWRVHASFWPWAGVSLLLGLGFTFFSGAVEAWLADALEAADFHGDLDVVLGRGQMVSGVAMLGGSLAGGAIAQATNLGVPFLVRAGVLMMTFAGAFLLMRDLGFEPQRAQRPLAAIRTVLRGSLDDGLKNPPVRWVMLAAPFASGSALFAFYAMQPYLVQVHGGSGAYAIAGLAASVVAATQIVGGWAAPKLRRLVGRRTTALTVTATVGALALGLLGAATTLWLVLVFIGVWGLSAAADRPIRQAYVNGMIPTQRRATILSFDSLMASTGGVVLQPILGEVADRYGYRTSFLVAGGFALLAVPFIVLSRRLRAPADSAQAAPHEGGC